MSLRLERGHEQTPQRSAERVNRKSSLTQLCPSSRRASMCPALRKARQPAEVALTLSIELGLRAIELAALTFGDVYRPEGEFAPRSRSSRLTRRLRRASSISTSIRRSFAGFLLTIARRNSAVTEELIASRSFDLNAGCLTAASMARFITGLYHRAGIAAGSSRSGRRTLLDRPNR